MRGTIGWLTILAVLWAVGPSPAAAAAPKTLKGKLIKLKEPPRAQLNGRSPVHPVGETISIGTTSLAVELAAGRLKVGTSGGEPPRRQVTSGKSVVVKDGERTVNLTFVQADDGAWQYFATDSYRYKVDGVAVTLVDIDADGRFDDFAHDGWTSYGSLVAVPLQRALPLSSHVLEIAEIARDGKTLSATLVPMKASEMQTDALQTLNRLRALHGLAPVALDTKLSKGCTEHAQYLKLNGWTGRTNPHSQSLGPRGATADGAAAAARSVVGAGPPRTGVLGFWLTYYHRISMLDPVLESVGINSEVPSLSVINTGTGRGTSRSVWQDPVCIPADGGTSCPTGAVSEKPNDPVTDMGRRGWPLTVYFAARRPDVSDFEAKLVQLKGRKGIAVPLLRADQGRFSNVFGFVPEKRLKGGTWYRASYTWTSGGKSLTRSVRFRTE